MNDEYIYHSVSVDRNALGVVRDPPTGYGPVRSNNCGLLIEKPLKRRTISLVWESCHMSDF
jgi:hypothetical protein